LVNRFTDIASVEANRRVSVQIGMTAPVKTNYVVSQNDLWDTQTLKQRQSARNAANAAVRCPDHGLEQNGSPGPIQRSVSEKNRTKHRHKPKNVCQSETDSEKERETTPLCSQNRKLIKTSHQHSHHHSTPNVAPPDKHQPHKHRIRKDKSSSTMCGASSESELLDGDTAILPIFRKLLTEKESRYRHRNMVGASCPNISIKCDIVEYL
jgi:gamma-aminobutyric acid type B receptor